MDRRITFGKTIPSFKEITGVKDGHFLDKDGNPISEEVAELMRCLQDAGIDDDGWEVASL